MLVILPLPLHQSILILQYVFRPRILDKRYGCGYEYYFDSMFCMVKGSYAMIVEGVDFNGNPFRRAATFQCADGRERERDRRLILVFSGPPQTTQPPTSTVTTPMPTACDNGGVFLFNGLQSSCVCQDHWAGGHCEQPLVRKSSLTQ